MLRENTQGEKGEGKAVELISASNCCPVLHLLCCISALQFDMLLVVSRQLPECVLLKYGWAFH